MSSAPPTLDGLVPDHLKVRSVRIFVEAMEVTADIGFHDFEVGRPQRLLVSVDVWLDDTRLPEGDDPALAWDYDLIRSHVQELAAARRYNLQETLAYAIFDRLAAMRGVTALRVRTCKADVYKDARGVGVDIASFSQPVAPT